MLSITIFSFLYPETIDMSLIPFFLNISICVINNDFPANSINDFGLSFVKGNNLLPSPAAKIITLVIHQTVSGVSPQHRYVVCFKDANGFLHNF